MKKTTYKLIGEKSGNPEIIEVLPKVKKEGREMLTDADHELFHRALATKGIHHVPRHIYQVMYDMAPRSNDPVEIKVCQDKTRAYLLKWIEDEFPGMQLDNFTDFSQREATALHPSLRWGMYVKVSPKGLALPDPNRMQSGMLDMIKLELSRI